MGFNIAVVGATGVVGRTMLTVLAEREVAIDALFLVASEKSAGQEIEFGGEKHTVITVEEALTKPIDIALFSAGKALSKEYARSFADKGAFVIDNSSAWRMDPAIKLIVPEINGDSLTLQDKIIANPNCSTIQMVLTLAPLHRVNPIKRLVISTYQSVSGTGKDAVLQLEAEIKGAVAEKVYPHPIFMNVLPHCDVFSDDGYTLEELKLVNETRKIIGDDNIAITATAVRVPVVGGHSESVNIEFERPFDVAELKEILARTAGVTVVDDPAKNQYPMPIDAEGKDDVFVGRIRKDLSNPNAVNVWIVSDNLRKGAATNAVQIAEHVIKTVI
ncbi:MAG: aspartate-semialdehyde dehydrogenase [Flavobacteriales bacterium]|nr:aspartate-semialdehyde dehydrogenase [Flavobacteriales bacterium]